MTMPSNAAELGARLPSAGEKAAANQLRKILAAKVAEGSDEVRLGVIDEGKRSDVVLTPALSGLLMELLRRVPHPPRPPHGPHSPALVVAARPTR